jgi:predicted transcriptional regulator
MKRILIELDDRTARDLEQVAPARERKRAQFIRLAIRYAIDKALDRVTQESYRREPLEEWLDARDLLLGWDPQNQLVTRPRRARTKKSRGHTA